MRISNAAFRDLTRAPRFCWNLAEARQVFAQTRKSGRTAINGFFPGNQSSLTDLIRSSFRQPLAESGCQPIRRGAKLDRIAPPAISKGVPAKRADPQREMVSDHAVRSQHLGYQDAEKCAVPGNRQSSG
jgi:hypothetical protein